MHWFRYSYQKYIKPGFILFTFFTIFFGLIYPGVITLILQLGFPYQANGSIIYHNNKVIGSKIIGQQFNKPEYLWGRLSSTSGFPYNPTASGGSNLSTTNPLLIENAKKRIDLLKKYPTNSELIPIDLVTSSASGLDPHISLAAALYQIPRIAQARKVNPLEIKNIIYKHTKNRFWNVLGETTVNVLQVNLDLDTLD